MTRSAKRYHEFDALRGFAMLLGIVLHGLLSFMLLPVWPAQDIHQSQTVYPLVLHAIHGFRMPVFFLISGFFTAMMWRKRGVKGLIIHRTQRILLPLLLGTIVISPMMIALDHWGGIVKERHAKSQWTSQTLWNAAKAGDLAGLHHMLLAGADVNGRDSRGVSPLEWAALYGHPQVIALLVENGADVNARNRHGSTPLHAAACFGQTEAAKTLVELGASPDVQNHRGDTPLTAAAMDMGVVHYIAGILQMQVDGDAVAAARRDTLTYLQALSGERSRGAGELGGTGQEAGRHAGVATMNGRTAGDGQDPLLELLSSVYYQVTFAPVFHHLWFLNYLLWLLGLFLFAIWIRRWIRLRVPAWIIATPWCLFWLIPLTLVPQLFMRQTFGPDTAPGVLPWPPALLYYAIFFGFGALASGRREFEANAGRHWMFLFLAAVPILAAGLHFLRVREVHPVGHAVVSLCAVLYAWFMVFGMIGFFRRFFAREDRRIRYLSDSSYWLYLAHLPLIIALQIWLSDWNVPHFLKFPLVCTLTFVILLVIYKHLVRYTLVGTMLNGKKTRRASSSFRSTGFAAGKA